MERWVISTLQQIVYGDAKIVREEYQRLVIRLTFAGLISAEGILVHIQFDRKSLLGQFFSFSQFFQSHIIFTKEISAALSVVEKIMYFLDNIIPFWYNKNIPIRDILK